MRVLLNTSPTKNGHAHRGIGLYTSQLYQQLSVNKDVELLTAETSRKQKPDLVHYPFFDLFFPTLPLFRPAAKTVVTIHDVIPLLFPEFYKPGIKGSLAFAAQKLALSNVDAVITDSVSSKKDIEKYLSIAEDKVHVVYLAGNPAMVKQPPSVIAQVSNTYQLPAQYVLYVGDINYNKNIPQLIKALKFLPEEVQLVLVGKNFRRQEIPEWQWIETQAALSNVASRIKFIPDLTGDVDAELSAIYSAASVYIQPSLAEGFGLPVLEAMQCYTPVVCTNETSLPEVAGNHAQYCEPKAESIAEAISDVLQFSQAKKKQITEQAHEWATQFSWKKASQETIEVYKKITR
jgi:glycosyltransferase involved in cell wall biosynthesis